MATPTRSASPTPYQITPVPTPTHGYTQNPTSQSPIQYRAWVDSDYGFYEVRAIKDNASYELALDFDTRNFSINEGDTVRWINNDLYDYSLTIVNNEGLWTGETAFLEYQGKLFEYTFNKTDVYTFHVKEFPKIHHRK